MPSILVSFTLQNQLGSLGAQTACKDPVIRAGVAPPSGRTNRPHKDRHLLKLLQLAIAIRHYFFPNNFAKNPFFCGSSFTEGLLVFTASSALFSEP